MSYISKNAVSNGLVGATVSVGYGAIPPTHNLPSYVGAVTSQLSGQVYITNNTGSSGAGGSGFLTTGSNGTTWANPTSTKVMVVKDNPAELEVKGRMVLNGRDLEERLDTIEKVLQIPERDVKLEKKHPKLKKLYNDYINALGKYRTFEAIKGDDDE
jgi:hypothetical protein